MKSVLLTAALAGALFALGNSGFVPEPSQGTAEPGINAASPAPSDSTPADLAALDWMVGVWVDQSGDSQVTTSCFWTHNRQFLKRTFKVQSQGRLVMEGAQVVGWDPIENRVRSWTFDSEGGFGEGWWIRDGDQWLVKTAFTLASGERASALNVFQYVNSDSFRWQSTSREIGGVLQPDLPEVTIRRQPVSGICCPQ